MYSQTFQHVRESFRGQTLMSTFGGTLKSVEAGKVAITCQIQDFAKQQQGLAHAGLTFALGDTAAGYAALSLLGEDMEVVTAEMKINLLAPGRGTSLRAEGRVIKPGKRLIVVAADVFAIDEAGQETCIAILQGTIVPVPA